MLNTFDSTLERKSVSVAVNAAAWLNTKEQGTVYSVESLIRTPVKQKHLKDS